MKTDLQWQPIETAPRDGRIVLVNDTNEGLSPWAFASYLDSDDWAEQTTSYVTTGAKNNDRRRIDDVDVAR